MKQAIQQRVVLLVLVILAIGLAVHYRAQLSRALAIPEGGEEVCRFRLPWSSRLSLAVSR